MTDTISIPAGLITNVATLTLSGTTVYIDCASRSDAEAVLDCLVEGAPNVPSFIESTGNVFRDLGFENAVEMLAEADAKIAAEDGEAIRTMDDLKAELGTKTSAETFRAMLRMAKGAVGKVKS